MMRSSCGRRERTRPERTRPAAGAPAQHRLDQRARAAPGERGGAAWNARHGLGADRRARASGPPLDRAPGQLGADVARAAHPALPAAADRGRRRLRCRRRRRPHQVAQRHRDPASTGTREARRDTHGGPPPGGLGGPRDRPERRRPPRGAARRAAREDRNARALGAGDRADSGAPAGGARPASRGGRGGDARPPGASAMRCAAARSSGAPTARRACRSGDARRESMARDA